MRFKIGDQVIHSNYGGGEIIAIEERQFDDTQAARLFYTVAINRSTVWVPVDEDGGTPLRLRATKKLLVRCRQVLKSQPNPLSDDKRQRYVDISSRTRQASFESLCEVLRDVTALGWPKSLVSTDAQIWRKINEAVCQEWAHAAGIPAADAQREITALLDEGRRLHQR
jgi:RNA polymerase-interacting CarD/CdnL/TRCF family regulator